jgi:hypothetical protein
MLTKPEGPLLRSVGEHLSQSPSYEYIWLLEAMSGSETEGVKLLLDHRRRWWRVGDDCGQAVAC